MTTTLQPPQAPAPQRRTALERASRWHNNVLIFGLAGIVLFSVVRVITGAHRIDDGGTVQATIIATCPILMAAMGGLWSERAGVVNIGLEGQMILGTWGAAYFTYYYGPWAGVIGAAAMGAIGGLLHAIATVSFGVDHIVSGVAINIIALGTASFLAETYFSDLEGGGFKQLNGLERPANITIPGLSDAATNLTEKHWFFVSDVAGIISGITTDLSLLAVLIAVMVGGTAWILWRTSFGLRLRSCGENPGAAESLGVNVYLYKYIAVIISGAFAGIGGCFLTLVSSSGFTTGQTNGRGYIGLAAMIFGNWRPGGTLLGALMFGYTDSLRFRDPASVHALLLLVAIVLLCVAAGRLYQGSTRAAVVMGAFGLGFLAWYLSTDEIPADFISMTPYVATLLVMAFASQRLRMPAADGLRYRRGQSI